MLLLRVDLSPKAHEKITFLRFMSPKTKTLLERSFSTIVLFAILSATIYIDSLVGYVILISLFCNMTSLEWYRMQSNRLEKSSRKLSFILGLAYPWVVSSVIFATADNTNYIVNIPIAFLITALASLVIVSIIILSVELFRMDYQGRSGAQALSSIGMGLLSFIYPVWLFSFAFFFIENPKELFLLIFITKMCDIWAYVCGMLLGGKIFKRRFSPQVSPKKTWEGIIGSFVITSIVSYLLILHFMPHQAIFGSYIEFLPYMLLIFVLSVSGDLAGSLIKRGLNVKDSGSLLPGIGGVFDLIDSPAFTLSFAASIAAMTWIL